MSVTCDQLTEYASEGVAPALRAVDCVANEMAAAAFGRLFGGSGAMAPVLTILLTLYIAFFAFSLLTGRSSLGVSALTPRMLRLGVVLTFATSWIAYQGVVWNLAIGGPDWIAGVLMGAKGSATQLFGDRIDIVFSTIANISEATANAGNSGGEASGASAAGATLAVKGMGGLFTPESVMWMGALLLLLGTVGVLLTARIALGVLLALGPVFVVLALFGGTKGLAAGWLRGLALMALTPLFVVLGGGITLELLVPILRGLMESANGGQIDGRGAMAFFLIAAVHAALMIMVVKVAATMVAGWKVFGLAGSEEQDKGRSAANPTTAFASSAVPPASASPYQGRAAVISAAGATAMAEPVHVHAHGSQSNDRSGDRRSVVTHVTGGGVASPQHGTQDMRSKGIGSRFRASNDTGKMSAKETI